MHTIAALALAAGQAVAPGQPAEAAGTFDVKIVPVPVPAARGTGDDTRARMTLTKTFHGPLSGAAEGEMLTAGTPAAGSAGYVALERFTGSLDGRRGSFVMQHSGTMHEGRQDLAIVISPGSGTGELAGIAGTATIRIDGKQHFYTLRYTLPSR
ncbi:DUF3224 domain-containing protein [Pseudoduganella umbonata]|uniref:DUF3224 domain-containing protein n=1 Tax=Pseudoduganella umbonata TaxID=864828 RepID=A0A4P8HKR1_9BURK|nr:DUF3224 domain-containing protein [Pseudoduganella umbonata]MBB3220216.1 hypothetical protein [Pseudoduganella umbonata]QCP10197.1 DUF3224 domain-containing protein [Pseudoduganella umbonata]